MDYCGLRAFQQSIIDIFFSWLNYSSHGERDSARDGGRGRSGGGSAASRKGGVWENHRKDSRDVGSPDDRKR